MQKRLVYIIKSKEISSLDISIKYNKQHKDVLDTIRKILESNSDLKDCFIESTYKNTRGRMYPCYLLNEKAQDILNTKYEYSCVNPRFEFKFYDILKNLFPSQTIIPQYKILSYRIDFFIPDLGLIIEYDEEQHKYQKDYDQLRSSNILNELDRMLENNIPFYNGYVPKDNVSFSVVRIDKGNEIDGIRKVCIQITKNTNRPCSDFMAA